MIVKADIRKQSLKFQLCIKKIKTKIGLKKTTLLTNRKRLELKELRYLSFGQINFTGE